MAQPESEATFSIFKELIEKKQNAIAAEKEKKGKIENKKPKFRGLKDDDFDYAGDYEKDKYVMNSRFKHFQNYIEGSKGAKKACRKKKKDSSNSAELISSLSLPLLSISRFL